MAGRDAVTDWPKSTVHKVRKALKGIKEQAMGADDC